ncbi:putative clathrin assembly protein At1g25240 [Lactuca sativa]|uniref:putative clathrin assembly protein At1g25240 n=1 Tax=Lactuca sativa TaxID=4236 RepID=UPI000CBE4AD3|nr:putative clathrin assembly protein At1g25240 [Lactuca sativa]
MWKKASEAFKDFSSLCVVNLAPRSSLRNPDIEAAVIKATSHNDSHIDYHSAQRIFAWIRVSSHYARPVMSAISTRMEKTRSWTVALKGLMLLHGVFSCKVPAVQKIGRLPFNLSNYRDRNPNCSHHEEFIRAYYKFLDKKSSFLFNHSQERKDQGRTRRGKETKEKPKQSSMMKDLVWLENLQELLDILLKIKPQKETMMNVLVLEVMDCIMIEIFDIYIRICNGIAGVLVRIYSAATSEAGRALSILQKAAVQGEELSRYVQFSKDFGVLKASECPKIVNIRPEDIRALEQVINSDAFQQRSEQSSPKEEDKSMMSEEDKDDDAPNDSTSDSETTITDDSEDFDQEQEKRN